MFVKNHSSQQNGASMVEAMIAVPLVVVACLLTLQMMLLYRAKISLNFATQEAARIGAMSNGRIVPRFLTDVTQFSTVFRSKDKCVDKNNNPVAQLNSGACSAGSHVEAADPNLRSTEVPGASQAADGGKPVGGQFEPAAAGAGPGGGAAGGNAGSSNPDAKNAVDPSKTPASASVRNKSFLEKLGRGMVRYGDSSVLQGFVNGIVPLYTTEPGFVGIAKAQIEAYGDAMMNSCIIYHSPTHAAFADFGFMEIDGPDKLVLQIPNDVLRYRVPGDIDRKGKHIGYYNSHHGKYLSDEEPGLRGALSSMSVQDATLLSIEVKYSYPLKVPIAREILIGLARISGGLSDKQTAMGKAFDSDSLDHGRWPMAGFATYRMQTPVHWHMFYPFGNVSNIQSSSFEVFDLIQKLWNVVAAKVNNSFDPAEPQIGFCPGLVIDKLGGNIGNRVTTDSWFGRNYDDPNH